ncbi:helix-turn-helix domain-containing protein [Methylomonas montana]|uniref:helix-turn-helix domain-containing protein n=1 Tax=Methylomonas montana TaxID=3058963 RepID=UPI00265B2F98|nr:helix-turn-helix domain-containing protein [Methylomonas montana]WKJ88585.1 helix-turn-helix domain-containing protein [Methylomonas montana]
MSAPKPTQATAIKSALLAGSRVDSVMAFGLGITRLAAIIKRLRETGLPIVTEQDKGNGLARYRLPEDWLGGDAEQSSPECCEKRPSGLTSETISTLSARIPTNRKNPT